MLLLAFDVVVCKLELLINSISLKHVDEFDGGHGIGTWEPKKLSVVHGILKNFS